jgi:hypothetical protein
VTAPAACRTRRAWSLLARHEPALPDALVRLLVDPERLLDDAHLLKDGDRCTVGRLDLEGGPWVVKRFNRKGAAHTFTHFLLRSRAAWCWINGRRLLAAGLPTPSPVGYAERRRGPLRLESWLLTRFVEGRTLLDYATDDDVDPDALALVADRFAEIWRGLGDLRAGHDDMKATNFLVDGEQRVWMIDLDGMRVGLPGPLFARDRRSDYERFMRNWQDRPEAAALFRDRIDTP